MKPTNHVRLALVTAATLLAHTAIAAKPPPPPPPPPSSGTIVLDYVPPDGTFAQNFGLTVAPSGALYASGFQDVGDNLFWRGLVLGSTDNGATWWGPLDSFSPSGFDVYGGVMASDAAGNLYVASLAFPDNALGSDHFVVRRSTDGGLNWTTVDDFNRGGQSTSGVDEPTGITVDGAGDVYYTGRSYVSRVAMWTVRKGVSGPSFTTVDLASGNPMAIYAHPTAGIFAAGSRNGIWVVRRSTNGGATWSEINTFQLQSGLSSVALGIGADAASNLYVVGYAYTSSNPKTVARHWVVRKSTNGGNSWSTVDDFVPSGNSAGAGHFAMTSNGDLFVTGTAGSHWIVRKSAGGTGAWTTIDDYQYAGTVTEPHAIAANASGNIFVGGSNGDHWLINLPTAKVESLFGPITMGLEVPLLPSQWTAAETSS